MQRALTVHATSGYKYKDTPTIQLKGDYLSQFGFSIGTPVEVTLVDDQITIRPATEEEEVVDQEKIMLPERKSGQTLCLTAESMLIYYLCLPSFNSMPGKDWFNAMSLFYIYHNEIAIQNLLK